MAQVTGFGGVFFKSPDPKALAAWYRDNLGLNVQDWGGALLETSPQSPSKAVWSPFKADTTYFAPSTKDFMINFAVDDLGGFVDGLKAKGIAILGQADEGAMGQFAWILDPDGNKVELWQPSK